MKFLLIGGTGFIGSRVVRRLMAQEHGVVVFHRGLSPAPAGVAEILGDRRRLVRAADALRAARPDVVIDLTLSSGAQARELVSVFRGAAARLVVVSSCDVYRACGVLHGLEPGPLEPMPLVEASPLRTRAEVYPVERLRALERVFGWLDPDYDKVSVEREASGDPNLPATVLRLPMVYGPGDPLHRLFPILRRIDDGRRVILFEKKHAAWRGPRGYVENIATAIALAATSEKAEARIYNVAEPDNPTELDWARQIAVVTGWTGELVTVPESRIPTHLKMPGNLDQHWVVDSTRIRQELGYREPVPRDESIRWTVEWERANPPPEDAGPLDYAAEDAALE